MLWFLRPFYWRNKHLTSVDFFFPLTRHSRFRNIRIWLPSKVNWTNLNYRIFSLFVTVRGKIYVLITATPSISVRRPSITIDVHFYQDLQDDRETSRNLNRCRKCIAEISIRKSLHCNLYNGTQLFSEHRNNRNSFVFENVKLSNANYARAFLLQNAVKWYF